jgi:TonB family protein
VKVTLRADLARVRKVLSLAASLCVHASVIAWVAFAPAADDQPLLNRQIKPNATRIIWYNLKQPLPDISPAERPLDKRAPRARMRSPKSLVAGIQDLSRPPQLIWTPAPPVEKPRLLPSPNVVALIPPDRPQPRSFVPPPETQAKAPVAVLPSAPELTVSLSKRTAPSDVLPPLAAARKTFIPPVEAAHQLTPAPVNLPAAPTLTETHPDRPLVTTAMAKPLRKFTAPESNPPPIPSAAPSVVEAPQLSRSSPDVNLAIVGLIPARSPEIPKPPASQQAAFSAGPEPRPNGGDDPSPQKQLVVPGLLARSGTPDRQTLMAAITESPTSLKNLEAAARAASAGSLPARKNLPEDGGAIRVAEAPDPHLQGRMIYSMALQMPNVTSYSGSWIVWFAERQAGLDAARSESTSDIKPPTPVRKVDPKYVPAAADDRVEGTVRLAAVIRQNGHVDTVEVVRSLDSRLDRSAAEALEKWEFEPAQRNGAPIAVDAVFEIPFRLAPRAAR